MEVVDGRPVLIFSCLGEQATEARKGADRRHVGGAAYPLTDESLYVGRLLRRRSDGQWLLFVFRNPDEHGAFV